MELGVGEYCRVHIRVRCESPLGQIVAVSGSTHQLGYFDKEKVVALVTTPESYPVWYTKIPLVVPRHQLVHYKFCLMEAGSLIAFERRSFPRTFLPDDVDTVVEDTFSPHDIEDEEGDVESHVRAEINAFATKSIMDEDAVNRLLGDELANKRLFIVCYHLPVVIRRTGDLLSPFAVSWGESLIAKSDNSSVSTIMDTFWMGTVAVPGDKPTAHEQEQLVKVLREMNCIPVFLDADVQRNAYHGYCKQVMWPVFHNVDQLDHIHAAWNLNDTSSSGGVSLGGVSNAISTMSGQTQSPTKSTINWNNGGMGDKFHEAFLAANIAFCDNLTPVVKVDDVVWVHDYHLMQLPQLLREGMNSGKLPAKLSIVFYMHIPFPTSQVS
jgi:trehalose 6-phosphate synthase/phosphatase